MKPSKAFTLGVSVTVLLSLLVGSAFWVGNAYATTGCFLDTNGHWAETFICWMKDNGITAGVGGGNYGPEQYVTRAQMAVFMQKLAEIPPSTGQIIINAGPDEWQQYGDPDLAMSRFSYDEYTGFTRSSTGVQSMFVVFDIPTVLYGRQLSATGVEYCYAANASVPIVEVSAYLGTQTAGTAVSWITILDDAAARTDAACRYYAFATPRLLNDNQILSIWVNGNWTTVPSQLRLGRVTLFLAPTTTLLTGPSAPISTWGSGQPIQENQRVPVNP